MNRTTVSSGIIHHTAIINLTRRNTLKTEISFLGWIEYFSLISEHFYILIGFYLAHSAQSRTTVWTKFWISCQSDLYLVDQLPELGD